MPKRIEPKYGYQSEYLLRARDRDFYIRAEIEEIAQKHEIDDVDGFERRANGAAHIYMLHKNNFDDRPNAKHVRAALREIRDLAEKLEDRLTRVDDISHTFLWRPQMEVDQLAMQGAQESPYGHRITRWPGEADSEIIDYLGQGEIMEGVTILKNFATVALDEIPTGKDGRRTNHGLRIWMSNAYSFWTETLGRPFTSIPHKGEGNTPAAFFCRDCLAAFAPEVTWANINSAMRRVKERKK